MESDDSRPLGSPARRNCIAGVGFRETDIFSERLTATDIDPAGVDLVPGWASSRACRWRQAGSWAAAAQRGTYAARDNGRELAHPAPGPWCARVAGPPHTGGRCRTPS